MWIALFLKNQESYIKNGETNAKYFKLAKIT